MGPVSHALSLQKRSPSVLPLVAGLLVSVTATMPPAPNKAARWTTPRIAAIRAPFRPWDGTAAANPQLPGSPLDAEDLSPDQARLSNLAVPVVAGPLAPADAFRFTGSEQDRLRARTCLAAAILYEAGDDRTGEQAVAQVVLNRLRHRLYPKTICGVVFQGSGLPTGCQFTFTCDGSLDRMRGADAWKRAFAVADEAMTGAIFRPVGTATHYHADRIVPYWRDTLVKVAVVGPHIFYRMMGAAGLRAALSGAVVPGEVIDARIALVPGVAGSLAAPAAAAASVEPESVAATPASLPTSAADVAGNGVRLSDTQAGTFVLKLDPDAYAGSYAVLAYGLCQSYPRCLVMGWRQARQLPSEMPNPRAPGSGLSFYYRQDRTAGMTQMLWDCRATPRADHAQCLPDPESAPHV
jgi:spore germination cell wall hydrolase CwlJ-like protein